MPLATIAFLTLAAFGLGACAGRQQIEDPPPESARALVESLTRQIVFHLGNHDRRATARIAAVAMKRPDVQWVVIQDDDGQTIAEMVKEGIDASDVRSEIVRLAWQPDGESWVSFRLPDLSPANNFSRALVAGEPDSPDGVAHSGRMGTMHVGFGPGRNSNALDRLGAQYRLVTAGWTSPFRRDMTTSSSHALGYYRAGVRAARKYYEGEARTAWLLALDEDPHFAMAMVRLGQMAHQLNDRESARAWHRRAEAESERVTEKERLEIRRLGADLDDRESDERAIEAELIRRFDEDADVLLVAGNQHLNEGRPAEALTDLTKAIQIDPELTEIWNLIGYAESELGHWPKAEEAFEKYAFLNGDQANPHDSLGEFYLRIGHYAKALTQIETALVIKPDFSWAHYHLALANAELGRWDAAIFAIQRAREVSRLAPEDIAWSHAEIRLHLRAGRPFEASRLLAAHRATFPLTTNSRALAIQVALAEGNLPGARAGLQDLRSAVQAFEIAKGFRRTRASDQCLLLEMEGLVSRAEGNPDAAIERLDMARDAAVSWTAQRQIEHEAVETLVAAGRLEEAMRRLDVSLSRNPDDPSANWTLGRVLEMEGRLEEARVAFQRAQRVLDGADPIDARTMAVQ